MPVDDSSRSSGSSGDNGVPILDAEEVGRRLELDPTTIEWLKNEPLKDNECILVLSYQNAFSNLGNFENNKQAVSTALTNSGATLVNENVFKFDDSKTMFDAHYNLKPNMLWCFYSPSPVLAQRAGISQQPTITTAVITCDPEGTEGELTINPFRFFTL